MKKTVPKSVFRVANRHVPSGASLVELLMGLVIASIMLLIGLPGISHYFIDKQLQQAVLSLQGHIKHARETAAGSEYDTEVYLKQNSNLQGLYTDTSERVR